MGSAEIQGKLWGAAVADYADVSEGFSLPLWEDMITAMGINGGVCSCGAGGFYPDLAKMGTTNKHFDS